MNATIPLNRYVNLPVFPLAVEISSGFLTAMIQLVVSAGFAGLVVQLLLIRQNRRKIEGEASSQEANAASVLSGAALSMVESANKTAAEAKVGEHRAQQGEAEARAESQRLWVELNKANWRLYHKDLREQVLRNALEAADIRVPEPAAEADEIPPFPPPKDLPSGHTDGIDFGNL